jgi:hypothetical protein
MLTDTIFMIQTHTWVQLPRELFEVRHEVGHNARCALTSDGSLLILDHPEVNWSTRPLPPVSSAPRRTINPRPTTPLA